MPEGGGGGVLWIFLDGGVPLRLWDSETPTLYQTNKHNVVGCYRFQSNVSSGKEDSLKIDGNVRCTLGIKVRNMHA